MQPKVDDVLGDTTCQIGTWLGFGSTHLSKPHWNEQRLWMTAAPRRWHAESSPTGCRHMAGSTTKSQIQPSFNHVSWHCLGHSANNFPDMLYRVAVHRTDSQLFHE